MVSNLISRLSYGLLILAALYIFHLKIADHPPLQIRQPCVKVDSKEAPDGTYVEYTIRCLEYTGDVHAK
jgi:hypothetical protein